MSNSLRPCHRETVGCPWRLIMVWALLIFSASAGGGIRRSESRMGMILGASGASVSISCRPSGVLIPAMAIWGCGIVCGGCWFIFRGGIRRGLVGCPWGGVVLVRILLWCLFLRIRRLLWRRLFRLCLRRSGVVVRSFWVVPCFWIRGGCIRRR